MHKGGSWPRLGAPQKGQWKVIATGVMIILKAFLSHLLPLFTLQPLGLISVPQLLVSFLLSAFYLLSSL